MRPKVLFSLFSPVSSLAGTGPKTAKLIQSIAGQNVIDLLWHLPVGIIDRRHSPDIAEIKSGSIVTVTVSVTKHYDPKRRGLPYRINCADPTGVLTLVYFNARGDYLRKILPEGETRIISGKVEIFRDKLQMVHPDHVGTMAEADNIRIIEPVYSLTGGLTGKPLRRAIASALETVPQLAEWHDKTLLDQRGWPSWNKAIDIAHAPTKEADLLSTSKARERLAYDELLANQLALFIVRKRQKRLSGRINTGNGEFRERLIKSLPFRLTAGQNMAIREIAEDMASAQRMLRLLQGDVGSGKTIVALFSMVIAVEVGAQAALMAPTEILAKQHFASIEPMAKRIGVKAALITGRDKGKQREKIVTQLKNGELDLVIGTHTLFEQDIIFKDLAMIVVDEQHRFGVHQRLALAGKGASADMLVMTATPIPRTLMMTAYGDLDTSRITEKPEGRLAIDTRTIPFSRINDIVERLKHAINAKTKVYWVCPIIEDSDALEVTPALERYDALKAVFGSRVGLIHGRLKAKEKDTIMEQFINGELDLLVATTVIEVGVDVRDASIIVIEHAERYGLSQLHQLRGRVGRSDNQSTCLLLYGENLTKTARARLEVMRRTNDGFLIAEEDLRLRGAGEILGTKQSGLPELKIADLSLHGDLIPIAKKDAELIMELDPDLTSSRGKSLKELLYLFERDTVVKNAIAG